MKNTVHEVIAELAAASAAAAVAEKETPSQPERVRHFCRCPRCGATGREGSYPFSTCPPLCDDCF